MKVLHISGARSWGGNEQQLIDIVPELEKLDVENIVFGVENSPLQKECLKSDIVFITCKKNKLNCFANYRYLKQIVIKHKPDVIHLHTSDSLTLFTLSDILYKLNCPTVFSKKGMGNSSSFLSKFKYNYKKLSSIICVSNKVKTDFSKILTTKNLEKLNVVYDGISISRIKNPEYDLKTHFKIKNDKILIGNIANHVKAKDLPTLILMMNELINVLNVKNIHLIQIGDFNDKITPEVKDLIKEYKLEDHITLCGFLANASSFISQFELYVMSSIREGFPLTIYESFYKKTPIVSTKAGGIPEIVKDGENGYLVDVKDYKLLAKKIENLITNESLKQLFAKRGYDLFLNNYTTLHCAKEVIQIYKSILS